MPRRFRAFPNPVRRNLRVAVVAPVDEFFSSILSERGRLFGFTHRISPKGFVEAFEIYELRCERTEETIEDAEFCREWEIVYTALRNGPLAAAEDLLAAFLVKYPGDGIACYHQRWRRQRGQPGMA